MIKQNKEETPMKSFESFPEKNKIPAHQPKVALKSLNKIMQKIALNDNWLKRLKNG
ncbi:MAG: hypothetical protein AB1847_08465 [bacterium]